LSFEAATELVSTSPTILAVSAPDIRPVFIAFKADLLSAKPTILSESFGEAQAFFKTTRCSDSLGSPMKDRLALKADLRSAKPVIL
jgi:hypothetical protein